MILNAFFSSDVVLMFWKDGERVREPVITRRLQDVKQPDHFQVTKVVMLVISYDAAKAGRAAA